MSFFGQCRSQVTRAIPQSERVENRVPLGFLDDCIQPLGMQISGVESIACKGRATTEMDIPFRQDTQGLEHGAVVIWYAGVDGKFTAGDLGRGSPTGVHGISEAKRRSPRETPSASIYSLSFLLDDVTTH